MWLLKLEVKDWLVLEQEARLMGGEKEALPLRGLTLSQATWLGCPANSAITRSSPDLADGYLYADTAGVGLREVR